MRKLKILDAGNGLGINVNELTTGRVAELLGSEEGIALITKSLSGDIRSTLQLMDGCVSTGDDIIKPGEIEAFWGAGTYMFVEQAFFEVNQVFFQALPARFSRLNAIIETLNASRTPAQAPDKEAA